MATLQGQLSAISAIGSCCSSSSSSSSSLSSTTTSLVSVATWPQSARKLPGDRSRSLQRSVVRAMVQTVPGAPAAYAKEMERLSAKESLLLAFKDAGGFEALVTGKTTDMQRIDVNERITALERVNPTPRPTTSPFLEGRWNFEWFGSGSPGLFAARFLLERFPSTVASLSKMEVLIKEGNAKITANLKILNSIESKFSLSTKLSVEGPVRMKEEYVEGILDTPTVIEETIPEQLKGALGQAVNTVQQLPVPIRDAFTSGLRVPLKTKYSKKATEQMDVYSFGVVLLELVRGRQAEQALKSESINIVKWVRRKVHITNGEVQFLDPKITSSAQQEMLVALEITLHCTSVMPEKRPSMSEVVKSLQSLDSMTHTAVVDFSAFE